MKVSPTEVLSKTFIGKLNELFSGSGLFLCLWYASVISTRRGPGSFISFFYQFSTVNSRDNPNDDTFFQSDTTQFYRFIPKSSLMSSSQYSLEDFIYLDTPTLLTDLYEGDVSENVWDIVNVDGKYCIIDGSGSILFNPLELEITDTTTTSFYLRIIVPNTEKSEEITNESSTTKSIEGN